MEKHKLFIQKIFSYLSLFILYPLGFFFFLFIFKYRIKNLKSLRKEFKAITNRVKGPLLICPNHLTYIDSLILFNIFGSFWHYLFHFRTYAWNFPTLKNMKNNWFYLLICYLGKAQIIDRQGSPEKIKKSMEKANYLLAHGDYIVIFPEGTRSKSGRVDTENFVYGVGNLLMNVPEAKTLCVYLRGDSQKVASNYPARGENFYCQLRLIKPVTVHNGMRAARDLSTQIIQTLSQMETEYFSSSTRH